MKYEYLKQKSSPKMSCFFAYILVIQFVISVYTSPAACVISVLAAAVSASPLVIMQRKNVPCGAKIIAESFSTLESSPVLFATSASSGMPAGIFVRVACARI